MIKKNNYGKVYEESVTTVESVRDGCTECMRCVPECEFLKRYGTPKQIAVRALDTPEGVGAVPFECSLCGLCDAVCREEISPTGMFLSLRGDYIAKHPAFLKGYGGLLRYESLGSSKLLSLYALPSGCDTVFFPGCNLPGTRAGVTERLFVEMAERMPRLGLVLDCCNKPSHDLGREEFFRQEFGRKLERLRSAGVKKIITACPNCHTVFTRYCGDMDIVSVYRVMEEQGMMPRHLANESITLHDPCALRFNDDVTESVRNLLGAAGISPDEMKHSRRKTLCCGEGGAVKRANQEFSDAWRERIRRESGERTVITSCGGCAHRLASAMRTVHLLDLWFDPAAAFGGKTGTTGFPFTYISRFLLKRRITRFMKKQYNSESWEYK